MSKFTLSALALTVLLFHAEIKAITISSANGGGAWSTAGSWSPAQVPTSADSVVITAGNPINTTGYAYCKSLTVMVGASLAKTTTFNIVNNMDIDGSFTGLGNINFSGNGTIQGSAVISCSGHFVFYATSSIAPGTVINAPGGIRLIGTATLTNNGSITVFSETLGIPAGTTFINAAGSFCSIGRNFNSTGGTFDCSAVPNTFQYNGVYVSQVVPATTNYNNITFTGGGGKTLQGNIVVTGTTTINGSTSLNGNGFTYTTSGNWVDNSGVLCLTNFDIIFNSSGTQTVFKPITETFRDMTSNGTGTVLFNTHVSVTRNFTINSGTVDVNTYPYIFYIGGNWQNNGGVFNPRTGSVRFQGTGAQTLNRLVGTESFYNFQKYNTGTLTMTSNISVQRDVTITGGTWACSGAQFIFLTRNWANSGGTFSPGTSTVFMQGSTAVNIGKTIAGTETFHNLTKATTNTVTLTSNISCSGNLIHASGTLDVSASSYSISVAGNLTLNSAFTERNGTVTMNGSGAQTLSATIGQDFYNFEVANSGAGVTASSGNYRIQNSYLPTLGNLATSGATTFTFLSSSASHTYTASGPGTFSGSGFIMQRYISARAANWHDLSPPVVASTILDWDNEIYMSAVGGSDGTACCPTFYSVQYYDEPSAAYVNVTSTSHSIDEDEAFSVFLGDDLVNWLGTSIIDTRGTPVDGDQTIPLSYTGASADPGANLVGNGQNAFVDWSTILSESPGVDGTFYLYDDAGNYVPYGPGDAISPHQGLFVYATGSGQTLTISQGAKIATTSPTFLRTAVIHDLSLKISSDMNPYSHEIHIDLENDASDAYESGKDARFVKSPNKAAPNLTMVHNGNMLLVKNVFSPIHDVVTIPVRARVGADGVYSISANGASNIDEYSCVILKDLVTGISTDLRETPLVNVELKQDADPDRFLLYLIRNKQDCDAALAKNVENTYFSANQVLMLNDGKSASLQFSLDLNTPVQITVVNMVGEVVSKTQTVVGEEILPLELPEKNGVYLVNVLVNGHTVTHKAVINK